MSRPDERHARETCAARARRCRAAARSVAAPAEPGDQHQRAVEVVADPDRVASAPAGRHVVCPRLRFWNTFASPSSDPVADGAANFGRLRPRLAGRARRDCLVQEVDRRRSRSPPGTGSRPRSSTAAPAAGARPSSRSEANGSRGSRHRARRNGRTRSAASASARLRGSAHRPRPLAQRERGGHQQRHPGEPEQHAGGAARARSRATCSEPAAISARKPEQRRRRSRSASTRPSESSCAGSPGDPAAREDQSQRAPAPRRRRRPARPVRGSRGMPSTQGTSHAQPVASASGTSATTPRVPQAASTTSATATSAATSQPPARSTRGLRRNRPARRVRRRAAPRPRAEDRAGPACPRTASPGRRRACSARRTPCWRRDRSGAITFSEKPCGSARTSARPARRVRGTRSLKRPVERERRAQLGPLAGLAGPPPVPARDPRLVAGPSIAGRADRSRPPPGRARTPRRPSRCRPAARPRP